MTRILKVKTIKTESPYKLEFEKVNPLFSKSKIYIMYHGANRNGTNISKETAEEALHTIYNTPIVGEFRINDDGEGNFGGHGGKIEIDDDGIRFVQTTKPIGVVPESAEVYWETVKDDKDREREYLVVDGVYMWNRYYDEVMTLKEANFGQSMEIEVMDGEYKEDEDLFDITEFAFSAFCILGIDRNDGGHVEPAFEDAKVITYKLDKESFKNEFVQLVNELKFSLSKEESVKEGDTMLKELLERYGLTMKDVTDKGIKVSELSEEELEAKIKEEFDVAEEPTDDEPVQDNADEPVEPTQDIEEVQEPVQDEPTADADDEKTVEDYQAEIETLNSTIDTMKTELEDLRKFKQDVEKENHKAKVDELVESFQLEEEDVKDLDVYNFSLEDLEEKLFAVLGKKMVNFSKNENNQNGVRLPINNNKDDEETDPYGGLFSKYTK